MNFVHIAGFLGSDPEVRFTKSGQKVTTLRVAARARKKGNDDTIWWRCTIWGEQFDKMMPYLKKGSAVVVIGEISKPEIFTDREGRPQISMELTVSSLQFSPFGRSSEKEVRPSSDTLSGETSTNNETEDVFQTSATFSGISQGNAEGSVEDISDEEIPF